jgi:maltose-binding protein MalE
VKGKERNGHRFLVATSFKGQSIPIPRVVEASDLILLHGNGANDPNLITEMMNKARQIVGKRRIPIVFNEDDHYGFEKPMNNFVAAVQSYASWGFFDYRLKGETDFHQGYQSVPVDWRISSERKKGFFNLLKEITAGK